MADDHVKAGKITGAFYDLDLALKDALGEVQRSALLYSKQGGELSREDWARTESVVHAVGDKLRDLKTLRNEGKAMPEGGYDLPFLTAPQDDGDLPF